MKKKKMEYLGIYAESDMMKRLKKEAQKQQRTVSSLVRYIIDRFLRGQK